MFTTALYFSLSLTRWIQVWPSKFFFNAHFNIVLLSLSRSSNLFVYCRFSHWNPVCICLILHTATCPDSFILLDLITWLIFVEYKSWRSSWCNFLQPPIIFSLLCPDIFLHTLFLYTFSLCPSINVRGHISHPYKKTGIIMVVYPNGYVFR